MVKIRFNLISLKNVMIQLQGKQSYWAINLFSDFLSDMHIKIHVF